MLQPPATATGSRRRAPGRLGVCACLLLTCVLGACASSGGRLPRGAVERLPPLQWQQQVVTVADATAQAGTPDLLGIDDAMREFVARYAGDVRHPRQRLFNLHRAVKGAGMLDMQYDPFADGTAAEVFARGSANCLSYAHLFVALAREAGLDARYQWLKVRPQWTRVGEKAALRLHVNVLVDLPRDEHYMVDIDPLQSREIADAHPLSDAEGAALYHSNIAVDALADKDLALAWQHAVRALQLSPEMAHLWVNLGVIYRSAGQLAAAEHSYFQALKLDEGDSSAMNNLVVLFELQGRETERAYWMERVERHRQSNPYYHAWLGDRAAEAGDWDMALVHYRDAIALRPEDGRLFYSLGMIQYQRGDYEAATRRIDQAIERASLRGDIEAYRVQLETVRRKATAAR
jgi:Flp pilus assembly protein TadD